MISDRGKRDDILWFTLFHEIAHLIKHSKKDIFIDEEDCEKNDIEREADDYSRNMLIDDNQYYNFVKDSHLYTDKKIMDFAFMNNVIPGIVVGRLQKDGLVRWNEFSNLITRI